MKRTSLLPVAGTVVAVTALAVTVALVQPDGRHAPRPLRLAAGGSAVARDAAPLALGAPAGGTGYTLTGTLPAGQPADAPAYTLPSGPADASRVAALAKALKAGTPERNGTEWRAGGLFVNGEAGQSWWFAPCAADTPVAKGEQVSCATGIGVAVPGVSSGASTPVAGAPDASPGSSGSGSSSTTTVAPPPPSSIVSPAPEPDPMSKAAVRAAAAPVFEALGLDLADARIEAYAYGGSATLGATVGGLEVSGMQTSVQVDRSGAVQGGGGFLGAPDKGDSYPLVTARSAYDELPPMMTEMRSAQLCPVTPDGKGCGAPAPTEITGAHLGLMLSALADGGQALVPAWLFEVKGWAEPLAVVAVQKQYLPAPSPEPSAQPEPGGGTGGVPPAPPASEPGTARQPVRLDRATAGTGDTLVVTYGESGSCPQRNVTNQVKEGADTVYVLLEADSPNPDQVCTQDYKSVDLVVHLLAPLGDRKVVDLSTNKDVPRT